MKFSAYILEDSKIDLGLKLYGFTSVSIYGNMFILGKESNIYTCYNIVDLIPLLGNEDIEIIGYSTDSKETLREFIEHG